MGEMERGTRVLARASARPSALGPEAVAWSAAVPCALVVVAAIVWLGPLVGRLLAEDGSRTFWPSGYVFREPTEHARYVLALLGPPLLAAVVLASAGRRVHLRPRTARLLVGSGQLALGAFLLVCLAAQNDVLLSTWPFGMPHSPVFTAPTLLAATAVAALAALALPCASLRRRLAPLMRETPRRRAGCLALAALAIGVWLLPALNSDATIGRALGNNLIPWGLDESFAVLDGRTPLVDFHAQYAQLWPYVGAALMRTFGTSLGVWTTGMACASAAALLALYALLRRIVRSSPAALALFLPLLATGFFLVSSDGAIRFSPAGNFNLWPMRYGGPYLLAWLTARHVDGLAPRRRPLLFGAAGLVLVNNGEFGAAAFAGTLLALVCTERHRSWRAVGRLLAAAAAGLAAALAAVALLTLAHSGELPRPALLREFPGLYLIGGWALQPMPALGLHLALFATFAAALVLAVVRWLSGGRERALTAMLAWSGAFGLGAGVYYVGRSEAVNLIAIFSAWGFALVLLTIVVVRALAAARRRPTVPELAVLFGFGLMCASLPQVPAPWSQVARLQEATAVPLFEQAAAKRFIAARTSAGERVAILAPLGHRIAYDLHLTNVSPYSGLEAMPTREQLELALRAARAAGLDRLFVGIYDTTAGDIEPDVVRTLRAAGFVAHAGPDGLVELRAGS